jgi:hypothetical protein
MNALLQSPDPHAQLRALYHALLDRQERFDEFKRLLALYDVDHGQDIETEHAAMIRAALNARVREWIGTDFDGLSPAQMLLWRAIVVEQRFNVALSPWQESNAY